MEIISDILTEAKFYADALEWRVIPVHTPSNGFCSCGLPNCKKPGKHPRLSQWQNKASSDVKQIEKWWREWPDANVGVLLGPSSGLIDIEFDDEEGQATAEELLEHVKTLKYRSHRSTHHLFFFPTDLTPPKAVVNWRGLEIRFGTDGRGAQSLLPPSLHSSGRRYEWLTDPRSCGLADAPAWLADAIQEATEAKGTPKAKAPSDGFSFVYRDTGETLEAAPGVGRGNRHNKLLELVGRYLGTHGPSAELVTLALGWGSRCSPPMEESEVLQVVSRLSEKEFGKQAQSLGQLRGTEGQAPPAILSKKIIARPYAEIEATDVSYLWQDRIALGKLTLLAGEPGLGKTFAAIDIAAHVSTGSPFIDGSTPPKGKVAIITAEDGAGDTIRPRLDAAGADVSQVLHVDGVAQLQALGFLSLQTDLLPLSEFIEEHKLKLIIIDPLAAFLGDKIDSHSNTQVRAVLGPLCELCERHRVALLGITHLAKSEAKAINRVIGSIAFVAASRACWLVAKDQDDEEKRLFLPVKNNLARCNGLAYSIIDGRCHWEEGEVMVSADDIEGDDSPRGEAKQWLRAKLEDGPKPAKWLLSNSKSDGISEKTLRRAQKELGIISDRLGDAWVWRLPEQELEALTEGEFIVS
jgi:putative DNA primase/helicase